MDQKGRPPKLLEFDGQKKTIPEWAKDRNLKADTLRRRLKDGWEIERALTTPTDDHNKQGQLVNKVAHHSGRKIGPARALKNNFATLILKALDGLGEEEQLAIIQEKFKQDPIKFIEKVILPLVPKDELDGAAGPGAGEKANFFIEFNGQQVKNPVIEQGGQ